MRNQLVITLSFLLSGYQIIAQNTLATELDKLETFLGSLESRYVDSVNTNELVQVAIIEMLKELDPHSVYMDTESYQKSNERLQGKYKGIGIRYQIIDDTLTILEVLPEGGAARAGLKMGDQIVAIGADTIAGKKLSRRRLSELIDANAETNEGMTIWRNAGEFKSLYHIQRESLSVSSVPASIVLNDKTGYIKLNKFTAKSHTDFRSALEEMNKAKIRNLIVDLRGNSGGYLSRAIKITDEFLDDRKLIVFTEGLHQSKKETFATSGGKYLKGDLIVLIDENSASASEIFAGAIQDWDRGLILGRRSFGKGLVQRPIEFQDGSAMRLTISRYYTPTGRSIQQPYTDGYEVYEEEHENRISSGELLSEDSIRIKDSLVYYTPNHRKVYGGGGIVPDVFVSTDTSSDPPLIIEARNKGLLFGYALHVALSVDNSIHDYSSPEDLIGGEIGQYHYLSDLTQYLEGHGLEIDEELPAYTRKRLDYHIIPLLARFLFDYESYYQAKLAFDDDVMAALEAFNDNKFQELGLK